jgi:UDP-glucose 4-epimerase
MNQVMQGVPMTVFGDGEQTRAFSHIDDVAPYIAQSVHVSEARNRVFNIGAEQPYTINELASVVAEAFGVERNARHLDARQEVVHAFSDHSNLRRVFEITDPVPLRRGVQEMAEWAKKMGPREGESFSGIEVEKNLPKAWKERLGN